MFYTLVHLFCFSLHFSVLLHSFSIFYVFVSFFSTFHLLLTVMNSFSIKLHLKKNRAFYFLHYFKMLIFFSHESNKSQIITTFIWIANNEL